MDDLQDTFEEFLDRVAGPLPEGDEIHEEGMEGRAPIVRDDHHADRMVRRMAHLEQEIIDRVRHIAARQAEYDAFAQEQMEPDFRWQADEDTKAKRNLMALEGLLRSYATHLREMGTLGNAQGHALPAGRLQFRKVPADYEITDEAAFIKWAQPLGWVEMVPKVKWTQVIRWLHPDQNMVGSAVYVEYLDDESGQWIQALVPGVQVTRPQGESFSVKHQKQKEGMRHE
jgi:hypothetical protein